MLRCLFLLYTMSPNDLRKQPPLKAISSPQFDEALTELQLPNECRHPETGHLFLQAFQGFLEAGHWPYQAKSSQMDTNEGWAENGRWEKRDFTGDTSPF